MLDLIIKIQTACSKTKNDKAFMISTEILFLLFMALIVSIIFWEYLSDYLQYGGVQLGFGINRSFIDTN